MATFYRWRTIKGHRYFYREERWRENGKMRSKSKIVKTGRSTNPSAERKAADERYREVLRQNVYEFGRSRPGERYLKEALAREEYHRYLDAARRGEVVTVLTPEQYRSEEVASFWSRVDARPTSNFESRNRMYEVSHPSPASRAHSEYLNVRDAVRAEDARLDQDEAKASYPPKGAPTDEEEAMHAQWSDNQAAQRDEDSAEYGNPVSEAEAAAGGPGGGPDGDG
jgi:hypothetical protein